MVPRNSKKMRIPMPQGVNPNIKKINFKEEVKKFSEQNTLRKQQEMRKFFAKPTLAANQKINQKRIITKVVNALQQKPAWTLTEKESEFLKRHEKLIKYQKAPWDQG